MFITIRKNQIPVVCSFVNQLVSFINPETRNQTVKFHDREMKLTKLFQFPYMVHIESFLKLDECHHLIRIAEPNFKRSTTLTKDNKTMIVPGRTSSSALLGRGSDDVLKKVEYLASSLSGYPISHIENIQVVKYEPGQRYNQHYDIQKGVVDRDVTIFIYLNDVQEGGETWFPRLNYKVKPKQGNALLWYNVNDFNQVEILSEHSGTPAKETKYGCNVWIRSKPL